jgi:hypothetical protein
MLLAIARADVPYKPTAKEGRRAAFLTLAWPQLLLCTLFALTLLRVLQHRLLDMPEAALELSSEAVWAMVVFAAVPVTASVAILCAAWQARQPPAGAAWDDVDVAHVGSASR